MNHDMQRVLNSDAFTVSQSLDGTTFVVEASDTTTSDVLAAAFPIFGRLLGEKMAGARDRRISAMVDFVTQEMISLSPIEVRIAQQVGERQAAVLKEFGMLTAEQLAAANGSASTNRASMADNWRKRSKVFAVPHPDKSARERDIYPGFQFSEGKTPIPVVQDVLKAFGGRKDPWKIALWFTSNNGYLPDSARPVDLLVDDPDAVRQAALHDAEGSGI